MRCLVVALLLTLAAPAAAREFRPLVDIAEQEGLVAVGVAIDGLIARAPNPTVARAYLRRSGLADLQIPVLVVGAPAGWFDPITPVHEAEYRDDTGLRGQIGAYPTVPVPRERLAAACLDAGGRPLPPPLTLVGPDHVDPGQGAAVYGVDGLVACLQAGGTRVLIHEVVADPAALAADPRLPRLASDAAAFRARTTEQAAAALERTRAFGFRLDDEGEGEEDEGPADEAPPAGAAP